MKKILILSIGLLLAALMAVGSAFAGSTTSNGITLTFPSYPLSGPGLQSCEPWNDPSANTVTLTGIPNGAYVTVAFAYAAPFTGSPIKLPPVNYSNVTGGTLVVPVAYPTDVTAWPVYDTSTGERAISIAATVRVTSYGTTTKLTSKHWWVRCVLPQPPLQGCSLGYWRQEQHFDSWAPTGYTTTSNYETIFGVDASFSPTTLLDALWLGGGGEQALARQASAALLNASHPDVNYDFTVAELISGVQQAYANGDFETFKDDLDVANNVACPLD